jgi:hypothetical protein
MIALRMARLAPIQANMSLSPSAQDTTTLAFSYLYLFRRIVVGLAVVGAMVAFVEQWTSLVSVFVCVGVGELLESSYYISVLRWRQKQTSSRATIHTTEPAASASADR